MNDWREGQDVLNKKPAVGAAGNGLQGGHLVPQICFGDPCSCSLKPGKAASGRRAYLFRGQGAGTWGRSSAAPWPDPTFPNGVTKENVLWIRAIVTILNYTSTAQRGQSRCVFPCLASWGKCTNASGQPQNPAEYTCSRRRSCPKDTAVRASGRLILWPVTTEACSRR